MRPRKIKNHNGINADDKKLIARFLDLPEAKQKEIHESGQGVRFVLISRASSFSRNSDPEFYRNGNQPKQFRHDRHKLHVLTGPSHDDIPTIKRKKGVTIIPSSCGDQSIAKVLSGLDKQ